MSLYYKEHKCYSEEQEKCHPNCKFKGYNDPSNSIVHDYLFSNNPLIFPTDYCWNIYWKCMTNNNSQSWESGFSAFQLVSPPELLNSSLNNLTVFRVQFLSSSMNFITLATREASTMFLNNCLQEFLLEPLDGFIISSEGTYVSQSPIFLNLLNSFLNFLHNLLISLDHQGTKLGKLGVVTVQF